MKKTILTAFSICLAVFATSCEDDTLPCCNDGQFNNFSFSTAEQIVEVDETTTSFRIEGEFPIEFTHNPWVWLNTTTTTAKHKFHFINTGDPGDIGEFTQSDGLKIYRDVTIIPENITEEVIISYSTSQVSCPYHPFVPGPNYTRDLTVRLRPKKVN